MKTIKIKEDFQIPGTDVILESGDSLRVQEASGGGFPPRLERALEDFIEDMSPGEDFVQAGDMFGMAIVDFIENSNQLFQEGVLRTIKRYLM